MGINAIGIDPNDVTANLKHAKTSECDECKAKTFKQSLMLKKLSGILSPNGQDQIVPIMVFACESCGHVNKEFQESETSEIETLK